MKKALLILAILGFVVLMSGPAFAGDYTKAMKYGIFNILGIQADHTYHCSKYPATGVTYCWSWTGGESNGSYISYSGGYGNYTKSRCTSTNLGCRFVYAVQGVCHQEANRGLYKAGTTIAKGGVGGYWLTGPTFGTYGNWATWLTCKTTCGLW